MKIAIATDNNMVSRHFGHCEGFTIFTLENKKISKKEFIENPGHKKGFLPIFLNEHGINIIISGGMGQGAIEIFNNNNIEVITGTTGNLEEIIQAYLEGELISSGSICHEHEHKDSCGEHE